MEGEDGRKEGGREEQPEEVLAVDSSGDETIEYLPSGGRMKGLKETARRSVLTKKDNPAS